MIIDLPEAHLHLQTQRNIVQARMDLVQELHGEDGQWLLATHSPEILTAAAPPDLRQELDQTLRPAALTAPHARAAAPRRNRRAEDRRTEGQKDKNAGAPDQENQTEPAVRRNGVNLLLEIAVDDPPRRNHLRETLRDRNPAAPGTELALRAVMAPGPEDDWEK